MKPTRAPTLTGPALCLATAISGRRPGALFDVPKERVFLICCFGWHAGFPTRVRRGFTLLELLLTLALLGVLLLLISGGYHTYIAKGRSVKNIGNHRQIISALIAYAQENKGRLPCSYEDPDLSYPRRLCRDGYITDPSILYSPLASDWYKKINGWRNPQSNSTVPWFYTNYAANRYGAMPYGIYQGAPLDGSRRSASLYRIAADGNLGKLMVLRDIYHTGFSERGGGYVWFINSAHLPRDEKSYAGRVYASFADGHVEGFSLNEITTLLGNPDGTAPLFKDIYTK